MTLYESNFIKFAQLAPNAQSARGMSMSHTHADCDLYLQPVSRERYTTTVKLTYWFVQRDDTRIPDPDLMIRIYHDARLVEAVTGRERHHHYKLRQLAQAHSSELDRRWRRNIMLNKWLDYVLDMGHGFA